jgi:hypothetical protein
MKLPFFTLLILISSISFGQIQSDYVVLRPINDTTTVDTVFGEVIIPRNGVFLNVKIETATGLKKFKSKQVLCLQAGDIHFASIKWGQSFAIVPRILEGNLDLYFYYTGQDRLSFIPQMKKELQANISYDDRLLISSAIWNASSNYYIYEPESKEYYKITGSKEKFKNEIAPLFIKHPEIYQKILDGTYEPKHVGWLVKIYNHKN